MADSDDPSCNQVIIIGAGPAGLTAAFELVTRTNLKPIVLEATDCVGGISRTTVHNGNRIDLGGHRFFSKSDRVMAWWQRMMPLQGTDANDSIGLKYQGQARTIDGDGNGPDPETTENVMLVRQRKSRIYFLGKLFNYPLSLSATTVKGLGMVRMTRIAISYLRSSLWPIRPENHLEDFFINRFGRELYRTFFNVLYRKSLGGSL
ncbi:NAD(P)-binding protein [Novipirellula herctigrandis]|uniref:NAD(P)-binding protein n=1 Tax=Novipirellula herctigrandis TaxID=2527986 RepID=UPI003AF3E4DA